jgi:hypothetical protein
MGKYVGFIHNYALQNTKNSVLGILINNSDNEVITVNRMFNININSKVMNQNAYDYAVVKIQNIQDYTVQQIGQIIPQNKSCTNLDEVYIGSTDKDDFGGTRFTLRRTNGLAYTVYTASAGAVNYLQLFREYSCSLNFKNSALIQPIVLRKGEAIAVINSNGLVQTNTPIVTMIEFEN